MRRFKKELIIAGILLGVLIFTGGAWGMNKDKYQETFSVKPGTVLKVFNKNGDIVVSSWERDYIEVVAIKKMLWWTGFLKGPDIDVATGKEFIIRTLYKTVIFRAIPLQYRIKVPKGVRVDHVETSTGQLQIHEVNGFVKAVTSTGNIRVAKVTGDVDAKTSTGEIQIYDVNGFVKAVTSTGRINVDKVSGDVDAKTATGEIQIHRVDGFVKAVTSCGGIDITGVGGLSEARTDTGKISLEVPAIRDNLEIRSSNGSITVFLSLDIVAQLEASTSNGNITYQDLPLTVTELSKHKLTGRLGEGGARINIKTSTGSINLKQLAGGETGAGIRTGQK